MTPTLSQVSRSVESSDWITCEPWEAKQKEWTRTFLSVSRMYNELNKLKTGAWQPNRIFFANLRILPSSKAGADPAIRVLLLCGADILTTMRPGNRA